jgi:hypothetical protein
MPLRDDRRYQKKSVRREEVFEHHFPQERRVRERLDESPRRHAFDGKKFLQKQRVPRVENKKLPSGREKKSGDGKDALICLRQAMGNSWRKISNKPAINLGMIDSGL